jgi:formylglycine-generating enzyme required for sulfatase activity
MTKALLRTLALLSIGAAAAAGSAVALEGGATVSLEFMAYAVGTAAPLRCEATHNIISSGESWTWQARLDKDGDAIRLHCGNESPEAGPTPAGERLLFQLTATLRLRPRTEDSHLSVKLSGQAEGARPESWEQARSLYLQFDPGFAFPLLPTDGASRQQFGLHDAFVRVGVQPAERPPVQYSSLGVLSRSVGARILLDGGVVQPVAEGGLTTLTPVRTGLRLVALQGDSGAGMVRMVEVQQGRTAMVALEMMEPEPPGFALELLGPNAQGFEEYRRVRDGGIVIRIPAGEFLMGNKETERQPLEHKVVLSEYLIDKTEVTWRQFKTFAAATGRPLPLIEPYWGIHDDHAVPFADWEEAKAHCEWAGGRLATEAEWEKAARGTDGRKYPWGNEPPEREKAVHRRSWGLMATDPATAHPEVASPYGALDMGGSMWEWCADWYGADYYQVSPRQDPRGPNHGNARVVRGGSWDSRPDVLSASCRSWGHRGYREGDFGFRCAMDPH